MTLGTLPTRPAQPEQYASLRKIVAGLTGERAEAVRAELNGARRDGKFDFFYARDMIIQLSTVAIANEEGMYLKDGVVYKVQVAHHGSGKLYAKKLTVTDGRGTFDYAPGMVRKLTVDDKMSLAQAKEFGALYGVCCVCGRILTNEASIEAGIGPICAKRF